MDIVFFGVLGDIPMVVIWLIAAVVLVVIEAFTQGLTTIWFAGGAIVAAGVSAVSDNILLQVGAGLVVSVVLLYFTRPLAVRKFNRDVVKTNISAVIGQIGVAESDLESRETGTVKVDNKLWTAVLAPDADAVKRGESVEIIAVEGVKLVVRGADNDQR